MKKEEKDRVVRSLIERFPTGVITIEKREIICEITSTGSHDGFSIALAVIERSSPHRNVLSERYFVEKGPVTIYRNGSPQVLQTGESTVINQGEEHWAEGNQARVWVISTPRWTPERHIRT